MTGIALCLVFLGCFLLSLSLRRHYRQVFADESAYERRLWPMRIAGYGLTLLGLWPCIALISIFALASFLQIMLLTYGFSR
jgi:hypothetical protein